MKEEPLTTVYCNIGVKGHAEINWGQPEVKLLRNTIWLPDLVGKTSDQSVMQCEVKGHAGVSWNYPYKGK